MQYLVKSLTLNLLMPNTLKSVKWKIHSFLTSVV